MNEKGLKRWKLRERPQKETRTSGAGPTLASMSLLLYMLGLTLKATLSLPQALQWPSPKTPRIHNVFTELQSADASASRTSLRHALTHPLSYMFTVLHVVLLYFVLCPLATSIGLH